MTTRWEVDVEMTQPDLQGDQAEAEKDGGAQPVNFRTRLHEQRHDEQRRKAGDAFQEEAERLAFPFHLHSLYVR